MNSHEEPTDPGVARRQERRRRTHLTLSEVAERWGVSVNFIRREIWRGNLKSTRFGRSIRVALEEVERYAGRCTESNPWRQ